MAMLRRRLGEVHVRHASIEQTVASDVDHRAIDVREDHLSRGSDERRIKGGQIAGTAGQIESTQWPARTPDISIVMRFMMRWEPNDIRSFMTPNAARLGEICCRHGVSFFGRNGLEAKIHWLVVGCRHYDAPLSGCQ
jgi:hypothetical protein